MINILALTEEKNGGKDNIIKSIAKLIDSISPNFIEI